MRQYYDWVMGGTTDPKPDPKPTRRTGGKTDTKSKRKYKVPRKKSYGTRLPPKSSVYRKEYEKWKAATGKTGEDFKKLGTGPKSEYDRTDWIAANESYSRNYSLTDQLLIESLELENGIDAALELMQTYGSDAYNIDDAIADLEADGLGVELAQDDPQESSEFRPAHVGEYIEDSSSQRQYAKSRPSSFDAM